MKTDDLALIAAIAAGMFFYFRGSATGAPQYKVKSIDGKDVLLHQDSSGNWRDQQGGYWT